MRKLNYLLVITILSLTATPAHAISWNSIKNKAKETFTQVKENVLPELKELAGEVKKGAHRAGNVLEPHYDRLKGNIKPEVEEFVDGVKEKREQMRPYYEGAQQVAQGTYQIVKPLTTAAWRKVKKEAREAWTDLTEPQVASAQSFETAFPGHFVLLSKQGEVTIQNMPTATPIDAIEGNSYHQQTKIFTRDEAACTLVLMNGIKVMLHGRSEFDVTQITINKNGENLTTSVIDKEVGQSNTVLYLHGGSVLVDTSSLSTHSTLTLSSPGAHAKIIGSAFTQSTDEFTKIEFSPESKVLEMSTVESN